MSVITDLAGEWHYQVTDAPEFAGASLDARAWPKMAIPQNWFLGGLDHHGVVWFRRDFEATAGDGAFATLWFHGVDYFADVYLNGVYLGHHEGYFEPFSFDVTGILQNGLNHLAVRVDSPFEPVGLDGWHMRKRLIKGVLNHHDCRPGGGWVASGQAHNTGGIWNRVMLVQHGPLTIDRVLLNADLVAEPPVLRGRIVVNNRQPTTALTLNISCTPFNFEGGESYAALTALEFPAGISEHWISLPVRDVQWWQPWDRGFPHVYQVTIENTQYGIHYATNFGFRTVSVDENYCWTVNGRRYFPRGSNYIASQWIAETLFPVLNHPFSAGQATDTRSAGDEAPSWFVRDVALMKQANLNLIRVHAHVLPSEFHTACDLAGILVWQDFPFQWGYSDAPAFHQEAKRQVRAMIEQLYNHPSIVAWCMHNESPWDAEWMAAEAGGSHEPGHNRQLDEDLYQLARGLDPGRHTQKNSGTGDSHVYPGWYYDQWRDYAGGGYGAPMPTEYGAQGIPNIDSVRRMFAQFGADAGHAALVRFRAWIDRYPQWALAKTMPPLSEVPAELHDAYEVWKTWRFHDFQPPETFYLAGIELGSSLEAFIDNSQAYQNNITQFATEEYRRHKYSKINGIMQFMFVEPWPAITWAVLDYWRQPKPAYYVLKNSMQPILVLAVRPPAIRANTDWTFDLQVVNDLLQRFPTATCRWNIVDRRMQQLAAGVQVFALEPDSTTTPVTVEAGPLLPGEYHLILTLHEHDLLLSQNSYALVVAGAAAVD